MGRRKREGWTIRSTTTVFGSNGCDRVIYKDRLVNLLEHPKRRAGVGGSATDGDRFYHEVHIRSNREVLFSRIVAEGRLVWVAADKREGIFCQPAFSTENDEILEGSYSFVGFRFCKFRVGRRLLSWCSYAGCPDCKARADWPACIHGTDFPDQTAEDQLQGLRGSCACSELVLKARGGEDALSAQLLGSAEDLQVSYTAATLENYR